MKKALIALMLFASTASAQDRRITVLNAVSISMTSGVSNDPVRVPAHGEIKLLCIAGFKFVLTKMGKYDSTAVLVQVLDGSGTGVRCEK